MGISPPALKFLEVEDKIEITQDDLLVNLIRNHTNQTSQRKTPKNILSVKPQRISSDFLYC